MKRPWRPCRRLETLEPMTRGAFAAILLRVRRATAQQQHRFRQAEAVRIFVKSMGTLGSSVDHRRTVCAGHRGARARGSSPLAAISVCGSMHERFSD